MKSRSHPVKRFFFWLLLVSFICILAWWLFYIPYDEDSLRRAVPCDATLVSEHNNLAARWPNVIKSPVVSGLVQLMGGEQGVASSSAGVRDIQRLLDLLASRKTIIALSPALGPGESPVWTMSTWIGGKSLLLRSGILTRRIPGVDSVRLRDGSRIWMIEPASGEAGAPKFSFATMDGVLFGCLSKDPLAVQWVLFKMQGRLEPSLNCAFSGFDQSDPSVPDGMDRGWIGGWGQTGDAGIYYRLQEFSGSAVEAGLSLSHGSAGLPFYPVKRKAAELIAVRDRAQRLLVRPADLSIVTFFEDVAAALRLAKMGRVLKYLEIAFPGLQPDSEIFASLCGGDDSGRIMGVRVPAIIVGVKLEGAVQVVERISAALDSINAETGWGLIPKRIADRPQPLVVIDCTRGGVYSGVNRDERLALTARGGWLLLASNVRALKDLVSDTASEPVTVVSREMNRRVMWMPAGGITEADAYMQADLERAGQSINDALAVMSLGLLVGDAPDREQKLGRLARARTVVEALKSMGTCAVWLDAGPHRTVMHVRIEAGSAKKP